jgi:Zn ribbon nucleic-acid-binding protein
MNWSNLQKNKCPQCNGDFTIGLTIESNMVPTMMTHRCGFKIGEQKFKEIVAGRIEQRIRWRDEDGCNDDPEYHDD